jgi:uncharacterized protein YlxP (DUF503 family)
MTIGILYLHLIFQSCKSLKEKRSQLKPLLHRIHKEFNVSISELDLQDKWTESIVAISQICNDNNHTQSELNAVISFVQNHFRNIEILENHIELL